MAAHCESLRGTGPAMPDSRGKNSRSFGRGGLGKEGWLIGPLARCKERVDYRSAWNAISINRIRNTLIICMSISIVVCIAHVIIITHAWVALFGPPRRRGVLCWICDIIHRAVLLAFQQQAFQNLT